MFKIDESIKESGPCIIKLKSGTWKNDVELKIWYYNLTFNDFLWCRTKILWKYEEALNTWFKNTYSNWTR